MENISELVFLFLSSLIAATIFPVGSEVIIAKLTYEQNYNKLLLLTIASVGNSLGAVFNWLLGYNVMKLKNKKYFPLKEEQIKKHSKLYQKWGAWSLLFSWLPIIGDPLTVIAGIFRTNIWLFLLLVAIGKTTRYAIIISIF